MAFVVDNEVSLPEAIDPTHKFVYRSGEYGLFDYWYHDLMGNYWLYTNAPKDSEYYDPTAGEALVSPEQPMPSINPTFFTSSGFKRNIAIPEGSTVSMNEAYHPQDLSNIWYEKFRPADSNREYYVYLDSDVRENLNIWVQQQFRIVDAGIPAYRKYAKKLFESEVMKNRVFGCIMMLADQGYFSPVDLVEATVSDLEFINETVKLLDRKFVCDPLLLNFLTELVGTRDPSDPLFVLDTVHGVGAVGVRHVYSLFYGMRMNPNYLLYWHSNHLFSLIMNRLATQGVSRDTVEDRAYKELAAALSTSEDVRALVDYKVRRTLLENYEVVVDPVSKALEVSETDPFGTATVWSYLANKSSNEFEFSQWLQLEPLHPISLEQEASITDLLTQEQEEAEEAEKKEELEGADSSDSPDSPDSPDSDDQEEGAP
jgi:hypothetical protein